MNSLSPSSKDIFSQCVICLLIFPKQHPEVPTTQVFKQHPKVHTTHMFFCNSESCLQMRFCISWCAVQHRTPLCLPSWPGLLLALLLGYPQYEWSGPEHWVPWLLCILSALSSVPLRNKRISFSGERFEMVHIVTTTILIRNHKNNIEKNGAEIFSWHTNVLGSQHKMAGGFLILPPCLA